MHLGLSLANKRGLLQKHFGRRKFSGRRALALRSWCSALDSSGLWALKMMSWEPVLVVALCAGRDCWPVCTVCCANIGGFNFLGLSRTVATFTFRWAEVWCYPDSVGEVYCTSAKTKYKDIEKDTVRSQ